MNDGFDTDHGNNSDAERRMSVKSGMRSVAKRPTKDQSQRWQ